eukprot:3761193-Karenia_brevis.AAC.1
MCLNTRVSACLWLPFVFGLSVVESHVSEDLTARICAGRFLLVDHGQALSLVFRSMAALAENEFNSKDELALKSVAALLPRLGNRSLAAVVSLAANLLHQRNLDKEEVEFSSGRRLAPTPPILPPPPPPANRV